MSINPILLKRVRSLLELPITDRGVDYLKQVELDRGLCLQFIREMNPPWKDVSDDIIWEYMSDEEWYIQTQNDKKVEEGHILYIYMVCSFMDGLEIEEATFGKSWFVLDDDAYELHSSKDEEKTSTIKELN